MVSRKPRVALKRNVLQKILLVTWTYFPLYTIYATLSAPHIVLLLSTARVALTI